MPHRQSVNPVTAVHLICRALALLFELAVLTILIYMNAAEGYYTNGIRYAGVGPLPLPFLRLPKLINVMSPPPGCLCNPAQC
ncbi:hypothetical protein C8A01DRAFT_17730 [Parachaetomium inaequale]|uniref:Uncharacterized protein n=1 Tax=Parachaetomium inaequale TaxID=2588326 RepID=A0AAN6PF58_9PEZI|nr:hypothetical protein C8A01DRAFT_17730 [Parachaetomium inaequale]